MTRDGTVRVVGTTGAQMQCAGLWATEDARGLSLLYPAVIVVWESKREVRSYCYGTLFEGAK